MLKKMIYLQVGKRQKKLKNIFNNLKNKKLWLQVTKDVLMVISTKMT